MIELVELSNTKHKTLKVVKDSGVEFAAKQQILGLRANEITRAATNFPVFFIKNPRDGSLSVSTLTSFAQGDNLFVSEGVWLATFQPSLLQSYPFYLMQSPRDERSYTIGIDPSNPAFSVDSGDPLFDSTGRPTDRLNRVKGLLETDIQNDIATRDFVAEVENLDLVKQIDLQVHFQKGAKQTIAGVYTIDEDKLNQLGAEQLLALNSQGYLQQIHGMIMSIYQLNALLRKHNDSDSETKLSQVKIEVARDQHML